MIIVKSIGGIGNQMFQVALCQSLINKKREVFLDKYELASYLTDKGWMDISQLFSIDIPTPNLVDVNRLSDKSSRVFDRARRKLFGKKETYYIEAEDGNYDINVLELDNAYLDGCWQSYKYFDDCRELVLDTFQFPRIDDSSNKEILEQICSSNISVSIHVRLGDYYYEDNKLLYGDICTEEYYEKAINYFKEKYGACSFFVFSNDKEYIKKWSGDSDFIIVDCNDEKSAWKDMFLMTQCSHNIIANSSFSWWGAWLNNNPQQDVIAPKKWINTKEMKDICPPEWIRI